MKHWCAGSRRMAVEGRCPVCDFAGKPTKYGMVRNHYRQKSAPTPERDRLQDRTCSCGCGNPVGDS